MTDADGAPVIGAYVSQQGTPNTVITDVKGNYTIRLSSDSSLDFSSLGYVTQSIATTGRSIIDVTLSSDATSIENVVIVGYGIQTKANMTGSVAQIDSKVLNDRPIQNVSSALQGLMPGVTVMSGEGRPGQDGSTIRVRGVGTLNDSNPLILIDGLESGTMNSIDPNDIASISVLKDAGSAAIYGSKASNGVILITTKKGNTGKPRVSYNGYVGLQNATNLIERLSSADYAEMYNRVLTDAGKKARWSDEALQKFRDGSDPDGHPNTDWYKLGFKTGVQHRHNVNVNGGTETVNYMASAGFLNQNGIMRGAKRRQFNARTNLEIKLSRRFTTRLNLAYINNNYSDPDSSYAGGSSDQIIRQLNIIAPWIPYTYTDKNGEKWYGSVSDGNPIAWLDANQTVDRANQNFTGALTVDYNILAGLKATATVSHVSNVQHFKNFRKFIKYNPNKSSEPNKLDEHHYLWNQTNFDATLNYAKTFGKAHNLKALAGYHAETYDYKYNRASRENFPNNDLTDMDAGDKSKWGNEGYTRQLRMISWFGRVNYDYAGKYLFEVNFRADATSRFAPKHRWGYFPSMSAGWRISEENFMEGTRSWLNNLKIRGAWGLLGNQRAVNDYYPAINTYDLNGAYPFGGKSNPGYYQKKYRIESISWEKARTWGIGLDMTFLGSLDVSVDYYDRKTTGIIMDVPVPDEFGRDPYKDNVGALVNRGVEVKIGYTGNWNDWSLGVNANFAYNRNVLLDLGGVDSQVDANNGNIRNKLGQQYGAYYMYKADGFFSSDDEAKAYYDKYSKQTGYPFGSRKFVAGDLRYADANGDGKITDEDRVYCNSSTPRYTFGLNLNLSWKYIDLSMIWTGAAGSSRLYSQEVFGRFSGDTSHPASIWKDSWTFNQKNPKMPRIYEAANSNSDPQRVMSTFWLQNTSFARLKNLQVGFTFPQKWVARAGISKLRIYYSAENLLTIDRMPLNLDPETTSERASSFPLIKTHSFGVNIAF